MLTTGARFLGRAATDIGRLLRRPFGFGAPPADLIQQRFAIPAYFESGSDGDDDWATARTRPLLGIVVVNPASRPGYTQTFVDGEERSWYQARMDQMHSSGADVVGYVTTNYRDSVEGNSVQSEHVFEVADAGTGLVATGETGWDNGFGPVQVRARGRGSALPSGLVARRDYFWIAQTPTTGRFATSPQNAAAGAAISFGSEGAAELVMGRSRTLANIGNVFAEIDRYYERYPGIDGIFFDEMTATAQADDVEYYGRIFNYVKAKPGKALVVENPGTSVPALMLGLADVFLTFEGPRSAYDGHGAALERRNPASKFWHAVYACPAEDMPEVLSKSRRDNAGYIYITDGVDDDEHDPWEHIASYFSDEKYAVQYRNNPPAVLVR